MASCNYLFRPPRILDCVHKIVPPPSSSLPTMLRSNAKIHYEKRNYDHVQIELFIQQNLGFPKQITLLPSPPSFQEGESTMWWYQWWEALFSFWGPQYYIHNLVVNYYIPTLPHCSKSSFFVQKFIDFLGVKNSWKCFGFGLFSCWQLWFDEKNCQKIFGWQTRENVGVLSKLNFWTKIWLFE